MRILLIAYDYPPILAAQSLRWFYLAKELAELGVEIDVICPAFNGRTAFPAETCAGIVEHRVWPGLFMGTTQLLARCARPVPFSGGWAQLEASHQSVGFRVYRVIRRVLDMVWYPDVRTEWYPFARRELGRLLERHDFRVVVSSHEPGVDLLLGLWAKRRYGVSWIVDLADPLCAPYSPGWRRRVDKWMEGRVINAADRVVVTADQLVDLLVARHQLRNRGRFTTIPQGAAGPPIAASRKLPAGKMNLLFTGTFYEKFRNPEQLARAIKLLDADDVTLTIVGDNDRFGPLFAEAPNVRIEGRMDHFDCLAMQREAHVLVNLGNLQSYQIPGKVYEYLGAHKPILHIRGSPDDPTAALLAEAGVGIVVDNDGLAIAAALRQLHKQWHSGRWSQSRAPAQADMSRHSWSARAQQFLALLEEVTSMPRL